MLRQTGYLPAGNYSLGVWVCSRNDATHHFVAGQFTLQLLDGSSNVVPPVASSSPDYTAPMGTYVQWTRSYTNLPAGNYTVQVSNGTGAGSNQGWVDDFSLEVLAPPTVLSNAPVVTATGLVSQVDLNWTAVTNATGYSVQRSLSEVGGYSEIAALGTTNYSDTNAVNGYLYWYIVAATNADSSSNSVAVSARPLPAAAPAPALPAGSAGFGLDPVTGAARFTISNAMGGLKYRIVYTDNLLSGTWTELGWEACTNNGTGLLMLLDAGAPAATQRFYKVEAALP